MTQPKLAELTSSTEITRFNALRHGVLSRYTVLPWEDADQYEELITALVAEVPATSPVMSQRLSAPRRAIPKTKSAIWRPTRL